MNQPLVYRWDGETFRPLGRFAKLADQRFVAGENYQLERVQPRSQRSHNFYFACIADAWSNLPEHLAERFQTPEALRKFALIKAGYADQRSIVCASKVEARRVASFISPIDEYAVIDVSGTVVTVYTAKSQSVKAMGSKEFQASKSAVLDAVAKLIGVEADALASNARSAA